MRNLLRCIAIGQACQKCTRHTNHTRTVCRLIGSSPDRWTPRIPGRRHMSTSDTDIIFQSPRADEELPVLSLTDYLFSRFSLFGDGTALIDNTTGHSYKYSELSQLAMRIGSYLTRRGYKKGDVLAYYGTNNPEFTLFVLGCASIGVVLTTANPAYTAAELKRQMDHSEAKAVVTVPALVPIAKAAGITDITVIGSADGCKPFSLLLEDDGRAFPSNVDIDPREDLLVLPYSSGTTGLPKGVMLTHYNIVSNLLQFKKTLPTTIEDNNFGVLPFFHIYGMGPVMFGTLQDGGTLVTTPKFDPVDFLTTIQKHRISLLHVVPPIVLFMTRHPIVDKFDLSSIRTVISAAAPLGDALTYEFMDKHKKTVVQGLGMTETSPVTHLDQMPITVGAVGALIANTEAKIVDTNTGKSLDIDETGEICIRGPQNMKGYLKNDKATQEMIDADGFLHTGDVGHINDNETFIITDRLKELIKYKGLQVAPAELENLLHKHPAVDDVTVIGVPDERAGELPRAYIVCKKGENATAKDIMQFVESHVSDYKRLRGGVEFLDEIPKSAAGKILRRVLKEKLQ